MTPKFHLAFPVNNLELTREFYTKILGCTLGRESDKWIDFNFYGHQVVAHLSPEDCKIPKFATEKKKINEITTWVR